MSTDPTARAASGRATLLVALSACSFGMIPIFVTLATRSGTPLIDVLVGRYGLAAVLLGVIAWFGGTRTLRREGLRIVTILGILQALIAYTSLIALQYISAATLSFLFYTYPAWVAVIARVRHSEPFTRLRLFALGLSLAGVVVMVGSPPPSASSLHPHGVLLALGSAMIYAAYVPLLAELQRGFSPPTIAAYMASGAAAVFLLAKVMSGSMAFHMTSVAIRSVLGLAIISTTIAFMLFLRGLRQLGPVRTAIISTIEPFCTALLGAWFLGQPLTRTTLIGGAFVAAAVVLLQLRTETQAGPA